MPPRFLKLLAAVIPPVLGACASVAPPAPVISRSAAPAAASTPAAPGSASDVAAAETPTTATQDVLEYSRRTLHSSADWLARGVDSWFGDQPFEQGGKVTDGRLNVGLFKRQDEGAHFDVRFNAHFRLPNAEKQAYLFIGRDDQRSVVKDTPEAFSSQQKLLSDRSADRSFLGGFGLSLDNAVDFRLGVGAGLKPYAQARYSRPWSLAPGHLVDFRETVFWIRGDRFGSTTALSYEYVVSSTLALRWLNAATITQATKNFEWSSNLGAYKSLGDQRLLSLEALVNGTGTHGTGVGRSDYGLLARWEQPVYKNWLLGEIVGGHFWPRPDATSPRGRAWAIGANLKLRF